MKKTDTLVAPLFAVVVVLLAVGAIGELFSSLFVKVKNAQLAKSEKELEAVTLYS